jgi:hypothetical protein
LKSYASTPQESVHGKPTDGIRYALLVCLIAGCGAGGPAGGTGVVVRDSAGITIVENPTPDDSAANAWWRIEGPELDIGGIDAEEPYALFRVTDAILLNDGRIAIGSSASDDIRYFDRSGVHLRTSGRTGEGPGEYQSVSLLLPGLADSLLVVDGTTRRVSVLDPAGEFARVVNIGEAAVIPRVVGRFADGSLLAAPAMIMGPEELAGSDDVMRPPFTLVRIEPDGAVGDTLGEFPGAERIIRVTTSNGQLTSVNVIQLPFAKSPTFAVHGVVLYAGSQDGPEIRVHGIDGALQRIIRTGRAPERVTEAHLDAQFRAQLEAMPEELRADWQARERDLDLPHGELVPPYGEITTDSEGNLWVSDYDDPTGPPPAWTVYSPDGAVAARVALPERFRPFDIGPDWMLGLYLDDLDVEYVRLYRIVK